MVDGTHPVTGRVFARAFKVQAAARPAPPARLASPPRQPAASARPTALPSLPRCPQVQEALENCDLPEDMRGHVVEIWRKRWDWFHSPLHGAGHCLDPEFWEDDG
jgi:hypothetical protein